MTSPSPSNDENADKHPLLTESQVEAQDESKQNKERRPTSEVVYEHATRLGGALLGVLGIIISLWWICLFSYIIQCVWQSSWKDKPKLAAEPEITSNLALLVELGGKGILSLLLIAIGIVPGVIGCLASLGAGLISALGLDPQDLDRRQKRGSGCLRLSISLTTMVFRVQNTTGVYKDRSPNFTPIQTEVHQKYIEHPNSRVSFWFCAHHISCSCLPGLSHSRISSARHPHVPTRMAMDAMAVRPLDIENRTTTAGPLAFRELVVEGRRAYYLYRNPGYLESLGTRPARSSAIIPCSGILYQSTSTHVQICRTK